MEKILIGKVVTAVGIKGEIKIYNYSDPDRFERLAHVYLEKKKNLTEYQIKKARHVGNTAMILLEGINDRNQAELLINSEVYIMEDDLEELPEGVYYIRDLIGCKVVDLKTGNEIGELVDVYQNSAQDNYEIKLPDGRKVLIPAVKEFIKEVDIANKQVKVELIPGFIDERIEA